MPWYLTEYRVGNSRYGDYIWARGLKDADRVCARRNIGEHVRGEMNKGKTRHYVRTSVLLRKRRLPTNMLHSLSHLCYLALASKAVTLNAVLGDEGLLHLFGHHLEFGHRKGIDVEDDRVLTLCKVRRLARVAEGIERRIPGYLARP